MNVWPAFNFRSVSNPPSATEARRSASPDPSTLLCGTQTWRNEIIKDKLHARAVGSGVDVITRAPFHRVHNGAASVRGRVGFCHPGWRHLLPRPTPLLRPKPIQIQPGGLAGGRGVNGGVGGRQPGLVAAVSTPPPAPRPPSPSATALSAVPLIIAQRSPRTEPGRQRESPSEDHEKTAD